MFKYAYFCLMFSMPLLCIQESEHYKLVHPHEYAFMKALKALEEGRGVPLLDTLELPLDLSLPFVPELAQLSTKLEGGTLLEAFNQLADSLMTRYPVKIENIRRSVALVVQRTPSKTPQAVVKKETNVWIPMLVVSAMAIGTWWYYKRSKKSN